MGELDLKKQKHFIKTTTKNTKTNFLTGSPLVVTGVKRPSYSFT